MITVNDKLHELFEKLVPGSGKADTVAGEIVRAVSRIQYRAWNDGDHIGVGYGKETCNPAARYLLEIGEKDMREAVCKMWGEFSDDRYDEALNELIDATLYYLEKHPELEQTANSVDMWDYFNEDEDRDDWDDEEDGY